MRSKVQHERDSSALRQLRFYACGDRGPVNAQQGKESVAGPEAPPRVRHRHGQSRGCRGGMGE